MTTPVPEPEPELEPETNHLVQTQINEILQAAEILLHMKHSDKEAKPKSEDEERREGEEYCCHEELKIPDGESEIWRFVKGENFGGNLGVNSQEWHRYWHSVYEEGFTALSEDVKELRKQKEEWEKEKERLIGRILELEGGSAGGEGKNEVS